MSHTAGETPEASNVRAPRPEQNEFMYDPPALLVRFTKERIDEIYDQLPPYRRAMMLVMAERLLIGQILDL